jgi:Cytochrome P460
MLAPIVNGDTVVTTSLGTTRIINRTLPSDGTTKKLSNNHLQPGSVFANDNALEIIRNKGKLFPEGSILVREKLKSSDDKEPEMLAVMIKREAGFNLDGGDWEFLLVDGAKTKVKLQQKKGECLDCHRSQQGNDFVYPLK